MDAAAQNTKLKRQFAFPAIIVIALLAGLLARAIVADSDGLTSTLSSVLPWMDGTPVTLYYADASGTYLVPVSRKLSDEEATPWALTETLLAGPKSGGELGTFIPVDTRIAAIDVGGEVVTVSLTSEFLQAENPSLAELAIIHTLRSLPDVEEVRVLVNGFPLQEASTTTMLAYYAQDTTLVGIPIEAASPRDALEAYLQGPSAETVTGLPPDVRLLTFDFRPENGLLSLGFTFTPALRQFAVDNPDAVRQVLIGLIATMTSYPEVKAVLLDFEGHSQLGLGQCANLLRAPQTHPRVLNEAKLLGQ